MTELRFYVTLDTKQETFFRAYVSSAFHPPWESKMYISFQAE